MRNLDALFGNSRLRPILPMLYVAWADATLSDAEMAEIRGVAEPWLDDAGREELLLWLDPSAPPSPTELQQLLGRLREHARELDEDARRDLAGLGIELARKDAAASDVEWLTPVVESALHDVARSLGFNGVESVGYVAAVAREDAPPTFLVPWVAQMSDLLDGSYAGQKRRVRDLLVELGWQYQVDLPKEELRATTTERLRELAAVHGLGKVAYPGVTTDRDLGDFVATFETLASFDLSLVVKFGVQFGLWGGSIYFLGTEKHHEKYLPAVASMDLPGCFAMSELGHGSNVRDIETTATYDLETDEFVIHTPSDSARKDWIGNAARDGRMATVFAQLNVDALEHGVHAFVVPLRDADGAMKPGVRIEDCGHKLGLNGVDNGRIWFEQVRIPRENMLDRYAWVDDDGVYQSPITSPGKRFFTMLGTLVGGRVAVGAAGLAAAKSALAIAVRYATGRRQFGPPEGEVTLLRYRTHQLRLLPRVATAYALTFAFQELVDEFVEAQQSEDKREVEALAAGLKSYATWFANDTIQECREACGGQGYLSSNRFAGLRADADIFATFEGDNTVLMQLVAKSRLTSFRNQFSEPGLLGVVRFVARQASAVVAETNPYVSRQTDSEHLRSPELHRDVMQFRDEALTQSLARRFKGKLDAGVDAFDALNECQDHFLALAHAHVERVVTEAFARAIERSSAELRQPLRLLQALYGLTCLQADMGWFMENGLVEPPKARAIRSEINAICAEVAPLAGAMVDAFAIPDALLSAPIGTGQPSG